MNYLNDFKLMLIFIGLGLWDEKDITFKGLEIAKNADEIYVEFCTSKLMGSSLDKLQKFIGREIKLLERSDLEEKSRRLIERARDRDIVILTPGDPMIATTHSAIRLEAEQMGIKTKIIHSASIMCAVCGLTGLHNYRFGKSATVSYPHSDIVSKTPINVIEQNLSIDAHTLLYLDLHPEPMTINKAIDLLMKADDDGLLKDVFAVGIARAGSDNPFVRCNRLANLKDIDFGEPLHILVVLARTLHFMEYECLRQFASAPKELERLVV